MVSKAIVFDETYEVFSVTFLKDICHSLLIYNFLGILLSVLITTLCGLWVTITEYLYLSLCHVFLAFFNLIQAYCFIREIRIMISSFHREGFFPSFSIKMIQMCKMSTMDKAVVFTK